MERVLMEILVFCGMKHGILSTPGAIVPEVAVPIDRFATYSTSAAAAPV
jgi:hypothetical protein